MRVCICIYMCVCVYARARVCMYVCMYVCACVCNIYVHLICIYCNTHCTKNKF